MKVLALEKNNEAETSQEAIVPVGASLKETAVIVSSLEGIEELSMKGYGVDENGKLRLAFYEALFLLGKGAIEVTDEENKQKMDFQGLLKRFQQVDKDAWVRYLIYRDLRGRGYVAREGFGLGIDFRVYERGDYGKGTAKHLIFGIQEGQPVSVEKLARTQRYVQNLKKNLVLAVINRRGEIVYYSLSELNLK
ncbi:MAG TPA: tRNA-intron lyase [Candidatus Bathyarchaeota archaeon]|nr:tRNA-intron lyase [Candidatus Bathyarchaeota archaeon]